VTGRYLQILLAVALTVSAFLVPFFVRISDRGDFIRVAAGFAGVGFALLVLGALRIRQSGLVGPEIENDTGESQRPAAIISATIGWLWVAVGISLIALQLAWLLLVWLVPMG